MTINNTNLNNCTIWASSITSSFICQEGTEAPFVVTAQQLNKKLGQEYTYNVLKNGQLALTDNDGEITYVGKAEMMDAYIISEGMITVERKVSDSVNFCGQIVFAPGKLRINLEVGMKDLSEFKVKEIEFRSFDNGVAVERLGGTKKEVIKTLLATSGKRAKVLAEVLKDLYGYTK